MRLTIKVGKNYYYDIGLRGNDEHTSKFKRTFGELHPKYLEDFIDLYDNKKISIISYGSLINKREKIDKMLE